MRERDKRCKAEQLRDRLMRPQHGHSRDAGSVPLAAGRSLLSK